MIGVTLFRVINDDEREQLFKRISIEQNLNVFKKSNNNVNTFDYKDNISYMHFFKFAEHARKYSQLFGKWLIMCDIPDDLIEQSGYGIYRYSFDDSISIPIPEYIINKDNFKDHFIVKARPKKRECIQYTEGVNKLVIYYQIIDDLLKEFKDLNGQRNFNNNEFILYVLKYFGDSDIDDILFEYSKKSTNICKVRKME